MKTIHCFVKGRVQGVGFRFFVEREARRLGLCGWVRNLPGGEVEILATGPEEDLEHLLRAVRQGPPLSRVVDVEIEWGGPESDEPFHIR